MAIEAKHLCSFNDLDCKSQTSSGEDEYTFSGYLSVCNNVDQGLDVIMPGAFKDTLREWKKKGYYPPMLRQHGGMKLTADDLDPIGKWTLMREDEKGLYVEGKLFSTTAGRDVWTVLKESEPGSMGMSIGYRAKDYKYVEGKKYGSKYATKTIRELNKVHLIEGSVVTFPMNTEATINSVKSIATLRDAEEFLREKGFSNKESKDIVVQLRDIISADIDAEIKGLMDRENFVDKSLDHSHKAHECGEADEGFSPTSKEADGNSDKTAQLCKSESTDSKNNECVSVDAGAEKSEDTYAEEVSIWLDAAIDQSRNKNIEMETLEAIDSLLRK